jgi:hypothetical protein
MHIMSKSNQTAAALVLLALSFGCADHASTEGASGEAEAVATAESRIINGFEESRNINSVAALYKQRSGRWGFTCSARVLNPTSNVKAILTARHCVTTDGTIGGPLVNAAERKVTAQLAPGYEPADTTTQFKVATRLVAHSTQDLAILWVTGDIGLPDLSNYLPFGMSLLPTQNLIGDYLDHYGYGLNVPSTSDPTPEQRETLGILRCGLSFEVTGDNVTTYDYKEVSWHPMKAEVTYGDSGGPSELTIWPVPQTSARYQVGVHSLKGRDVSIAGNWSWIRDQLTYVYLRNAQFHERRVYWPSVASRTLLTTVESTTDSWHSKLIYDNPSKTIQVWGSSALSGKCVDLQWNNTEDGTPFWLWTCTGGNAQRFVITPDQQLALEGHPGKCLAEDTSHALVVATCEKKAAQTWIFDHNPGQ